MDEYPKKHGGRREGAGRKSRTGEATAVKRIPVSLIPTVDAMIASSALPPDSLIPISRTNLKVPVALEKVPAGFPSPAEPYVADYLDFNEYLIANPSATFAARSGGYSIGQDGSFWHHPAAGHPTRRIDARPIKFGCRGCFRRGRAEGFPVPSRRASGCKLPCRREKAREDFRASLPN